MLVFKSLTRRWTAADDIRHGASPLSAFYRTSGPAVIGRKKACCASWLTNGWKWFHFREDNADWIWRWGLDGDVRGLVAYVCQVVDSWHSGDVYDTERRSNPVCKVAGQPGATARPHWSSSRPAGSGRWSTGAAVFASRAARPERVMTAADSRARLCGGRARAGTQRQLAVSERAVDVTGSDQSPTNKTNGVDWITGALPRQMTPRSWFMAFHVDLPTVPDITPDHPPTFVCRRRGGINTFASRVTWSSVITPRRTDRNTAAIDATTNATRRRCCYCKASCDGRRTTSCLFSSRSPTSLGT